MMAHVWQVAMVCGALAQSATQAPIELNGTDGPIFGLAWSPEGDTLASTGFKQVNLWRIGAAAPVRTFGARATSATPRRRRGARSTTTLPVSPPVTPYQPE